MNWQKECTGDPNPTQMYQDIIGRISAPPNDRLFGVYVLDQDRLAYPENYEFTCEEMIEAWLECHGGTKENAVLEIAERLGMVLPHQASWLRRELSIPKVIDGPIRRKPFYDTDRGFLYLGEEVIRKVRRMKNASMTERILTKLQQSGWPACLPADYPVGDPNERVKALNEGLTGIRFHVTKGIISWREL